MAGKDWYIEFDPNAWLADSELQGCSYAAKGLWMDMLALMHKSERPGYLMYRGAPMPPERLAILSHGPVDQVPALLQELQEAGVFAVSADGAIYSRRMLRAIEKKAQAVAWGKRGGSPLLRDKGGDNPTVNPPLDGIGCGVPDPSEDGGVGEETDPPGFLRWWKGYPGKRTEKQRCLAIWHGKRPTIDGKHRKLEPLADMIVEAIRKQAASHHFRGTDGKDYIPNSSTWLYNGRWDDEIGGGRVEAQKAHLDAEIERRRQQDQAARQAAMSPEERAEAARRAKDALQRKGAA